MKPEGWQDAPSLATALVENIFFAFKTPLNGGDFGTQSVFDHAEAHNWNIGLWVDLTNTKRYYNPKQVESKGVKYVKLALVGRTSPSKVETDCFIKNCKEFLDQHPEKVIGVHCTHGFNRTGFLICSFLSKILKIDPHTALARFAESRPPGIYRQNMVDDFVNNFGSWRSLPPPVVATPPWKESDAKNSKKGSPNKGPQTPKRADAGADKIRNLMSLSTAPFFRKIPVEVQQVVLRKITDMLQRTSSDKFLGQRREYLTTENFEHVKASRYMVAWQPQEYFRYLLYLDEKGNVFAINERNSVTAVSSLEFRDSTSSSGKLISTLVEGIFIRRKDPNDQDGWVVTFEMNDIYVYKGCSLGSENLYSKLKCLRRIIDNRRPRIVNNRKTPTRFGDPFRLEVQPMWAVREFWKLQRFDWSHYYPIGPNGLVFFPVDDPRLPTFSWVSPHTSTANFRVMATVPAAGSTESTLPACNIYIDGNETAVGELRFRGEMSEVSSSMLSKIVESEIALADGQRNWVFKRVASRRMWTDSLEFINSVFSKEISVNVEMNELFMALGTKQKASDSTNSNVRYRNHVDTKSKTMKDFESQLEGLKIS